MAGHGWTRRSPRCSRTSRAAGCSSGSARAGCGSTAGCSSGPGPGGGWRAGRSRRDPGAAGGGGARGDPARHRLPGRPPARDRQAGRPGRAPGGRQLEGTLQNALLHADPGLAVLPRSGIVHRLDKDTSGLLVVARTPAAHKRLVDALQARAVSASTGRWSPVRSSRAVPSRRRSGRHPTARTRMAVTTAGKPAVTHFRVLERFRAPQLSARQPRDRPHAPDPRAPRARPASDRRRPGVRRPPAAAAAASAGAGRGAPRLRPAGLARASVGARAPRSAATGSSGSRRYPPTWRVCSTRCAPTPRGRPDDRVPRPRLGPRRPAVRAAVSTRVGGVSGAPWDSLNLGDHVGDGPGVRRREPAASARATGPSRRAVLAPSGPRLRRGGCRRGRRGPARAADAAVATRAGGVCAVLTATACQCCSAAATADGWPRRTPAGAGSPRGCSSERVARAPVPAADVLAWLGPAIGPAAFEVGRRGPRGLSRRGCRRRGLLRAVAGGRWLADLYALAHRRLARCGVGWVGGGGLCTFTDAGRFFSFRRDGTTGRMASLILAAGLRGERSRCGSIRRLCAYSPRTEQDLAVRPE